VSEDIYNENGLYVSRFVGPADEGEDRRRWQFYTGHEPTIAFDRQALLKLVHALLVDSTR
jgi:hypothetical protein